mmetsp:Transcript_17088/g.54880  ORF Transcript_17088/g.54880 Transcript_17088/m.54880 type:complete len:249 (+) Transcript_17088:474-1220(+)
MRSTSSAPSVASPASACRVTAPRCSLAARGTLTSTASPWTTPLWRRWRCRTSRWSASTRRAMLSWWREARRRRRGALAGALTLWATGADRWRLTQTLVRLPRRLQRRALPPRGVWVLRATSSHSTCLRGCKLCIRGHGRSGKRLQRRSSCGDGCRSIFDATFRIDREWRMSLSTRIRVTTQTCVALRPSAQRLNRHATRDTTLRCSWARITCPWTTCHLGSTHPKEHRPRIPRQQQWQLRQLLLTAER